MPSVKSDKIYVWWRSCLSKHRYKYLELAERTAKKYNQRPYYCCRCFGYHLTSQKERK
jgi:hypothetical protein